MWEHVRVLGASEVVSTVGTHLGHMLPDERGPRYCINLCSIAGLPLDAAAEGDASGRLVPSSNLSPSPNPNPKPDPNPDPDPNPNPNQAEGGVAAAA